MRVILLHLLVAAGVHIADAGSAPQIKNYGGILKTVPGKKVYMSCEASGVPMPSFSWERDGTSIHSFGSRFSVNADTQALRIFNVKVEDRGNYTCIAKNPFGVDMVTTALIVMIQPECKIISPTNFTFLELTNQELVCRSHGLPPPSFEWLTNHHQRIRPVKSLSKNVTSDRRLYSLERQVDDDMFESLLFFEPVTFKDLGSFVCVAFNDIGSSRDKVTLDVLFSPKVISKHEMPQTVDWWEAHNTNLTCIVEGNNLPEVTWTRNGQIFQCNTLEEFVQGAEITSTCNVKHIGAGGPGIYTCSAENSLGKILVHEFHVKEIFCPPPVEFRPISIKSDEIILLVTMPSKENTPQAIYVLASYKLTSDINDMKQSPEYERMADVNEQGEATVKLLGMINKRDYLVTVKAWNVVGFGPETTSIININTEMSLETSSTHPSAETTACSSQVENNHKIDASINFDIKNINSIDSDASKEKEETEKDFFDDREIIMKLEFTDNSAIYIDQGFWLNRCLEIIFLFVINHVMINL